MTLCTKEKSPAAVGGFPALGGAALRLPRSVTPTARVRAARLYRGLGKPAAPAAKDASGAGGGGRSHRAG